MDQDLKRLTKENEQHRLLLQRINNLENNLQKLQRKQILSSTNLVQGKDYFIFYFFKLIFIIYRFFFFNKLYLVCQM